MSDGDSGSGEAPSGWREWLSPKVLNGIIAAAITAIGGIVVVLIQINNSSEPAPAPQPAPTVIPTPEPAPSPILPTREGGPEDTVALSESSVPTELRGSWSGGGRVDDVYQKLDVMFTADNQYTITHIVLTESGVVDVAGSGIQFRPKSSGRTFLSPTGEPYEMDWSVHRSGGEPLLTLVSSSGDEYSLSKVDA